MYISQSQFLLILVAATLIQLLVIIIGVRLGMTNTNNLIEKNAAEIKNVLVHKEE